jgi:hypothetical protein
MDWNRARPLDRSQPWLSSFPDLQGKSDAKKAKIYGRIGEHAQHNTA